MVNPRHSQRNKTLCPLLALLNLLLSCRSLMKLSLEYFISLLADGLFNEPTGIPALGTSEPFCFHS